MSLKTSWWIEILLDRCLNTPSIGEHCYLAHDQFSVRTKMAKLILFVLTIAVIGSGVVGVIRSRRHAESSSDVHSCVWDCPKTSEYNPVCGTDGRKYTNMSHLRCAQYCGVEVEYLRPAPCPQAQPDASSQSPHLSEDSQES